MATRSWNRVELIGNLTRDPEMRYTPQGTAVVTFSIATNRSFVSDGERKEEVDFHRIVAWSKLAELCTQLLKKGNRVFVSGRLQNRSWEAQDGQTRNITEIVIEDMILLTSRNGYSSESYSNRPAPAAAVEEDISAAPAEDLPVAVEEKASEEKPSNSAGGPKKETKKAEPASEDPGDLEDLPF